MWDSVGEWLSYVSWRKVLDGFLLFGLLDPGMIVLAIFAYGIRKPWLRGLAFVLILLVATVVAAYFFGALPVKSTMR